MFITPLTASAAGIFRNCTKIFNKFNLVDTNVPGYKQLAFVVRSSHCIIEWNSYEARQTPLLCFGT